MPASVYWRRRLFVLGVAVALVLVIGRWLSGGSDAKSDESPAAEQAGAQASATETVTVGPDDASAGASSTAPGAGGTAAAAPEGACVSSDVVITPSVAPTSVAGQKVTIRLSLQTLESPACVWQVNRNSVALRIDDGDEPIWASRECPRFVPTAGVVVRQAVATVVQMTWNARESNVGCTNRGAWVLPGDYSITAASLGGEPVRADFALGKPARPTIRVTETPKGPKTAPTPKTRSTTPVN